MNIDALSAQLSDAAAQWLESALLEIERTPATIGGYFTSASRRCGRVPWRADDPNGVKFGCVDDLVRGAMLAALPTTRIDVVALVTELYRHGDANEKRGVLRGAHLLDSDVVGDALLPLVDDALRTNDARIIAAAVQDYGAQRLSDAAFRQAVMKCVFVGIPLDAVVGLSMRKDAELARMLVDLAHERVAAGRIVPPDIPPIIAAFPESLQRDDLSLPFLDLLAKLAAREITESITTVQER